MGARGLNAGFAEAAPTTPAAVTEPPTWLDEDQRAMWPTLDEGARAFLVGMSSMVGQPGAPPPRTADVAPPAPAPRVEMTAQASKPRRARSSKEAITRASGPSTLEPMPLGEPDGARIAAVLRGAPEVFRMERLASGAAAAIFEYVRQWKLFRDAGFETMRKYAAARLGVSDYAYKAYAKAGTAVWHHFAPAAQKIIEALAGGGIHVYPPTSPSPALPEVPPVTLLRELPRALKRTEPDQHASIVSAVEAGAMTYKELRAVGRPSSGADEAPSSAASKDADQVDAPPESDVPHLDIFNDVPELKAAVEHFRAGCGLLGKLVQAWTEGPGNDVTTLQPVVAVALTAIEQRTKQLDDMSPTTICATCDGKGCKHCARTGWIPKSGVHPKTARDAGRPPAPRKRTSHTQIGETKTAARAPTQKKTAKKKKNNNSAARRQ